MREVITYVAFDDREFYNKEDCLAYEEQAMNTLKEIHEKYSFYDKDMNMFVAPENSTDIDEWLWWVQTAADRCEFIYRKDNLSYDAEDFIDQQWGYSINNSDFPEKNYIGLFRCNGYEYRWVKVDE